MALLAFYVKYVERDGQIDGSATILYEPLEESWTDRWLCYYSM
jgi:hypothetical protein